jgi:Protein of unknown function (DUF1579)
MSATAATPEHEPLEIFIGKWMTAGETVATEDAPAVKILASDVYEWMPGGFFILHTAHGRIGEQDVGGTEIIGYDAAAKVYRTNFFDSQGGLITETLTLDGRRAMWQGEHVRATSLFSDDGKTQKCLHERSDDGETWTPAMDITLTKVA